MTQSTNSSTGRLSLLAIRALWSGLAVLHAFILAPVVTEGRVAVSIALLVTIAFFTLKAIDVAWLRFNCRRRGLVAFILATALVHHDAIASAAGSIDTETAAPATLAIGSALASLELLRRRRRLGSLHGLLRSLIREWPPVIPAPCVTNIAFDDAPFAQQCVPLPVQPGRAPPR